MRYTRGIRPGAAPKPSDPVFVDRSGRRRRLAVFVGVGAGTLLVASLALIIAGFFGGAATSIPGWPTGSGQKQQDSGVAVDEVVASPTGPADHLPLGATPRPSGTTVRASATAPAAAQPTTSHPGQGADHRATTDTRASKSPGKPN